MVAFASAVRPLRKPGADTVRQTPGFCVMKPAIDAGIAGVLLMAKRNDAQTCSLRLAGKVGDRDAGQTENRIDAIELEGIDDQAKAVGLLRRWTFASPPLVIPGAAVLVSLRAAVTLSIAISSFTCTSPRESFANSLLRYVIYQAPSTRFRLWI